MVEGVATSLPYLMFWRKMLHVGSQAPQTRKKMINHDLFGND